MHAPQIIVLCLQSIICLAAISKADEKPKDAIVSLVGAVGGQLILIWGGWYT